jgi:hypothetical protein
MRFYNLKTREFVEVPDDKVSIKTLKKGARLAQATLENGQKVAKLLKKE